MFSRISSVLKTPFWKLEEELQPPRSLIGNLKSFFRIAVKNYSLSLRVYDMKPLRCKSHSAQEPLIIGLLCGKWPIQIRHPMHFRHPVEDMSSQERNVWLWVQPIPLGVTFSNAVSKLKAQSSNVSFHWNVVKETFELWALSFRKCHPKWDWLYLSQRHGMSLIIHGATWHGLTMPPPDEHVQCWDALSCRSLFAKGLLIIGLFCGKWPVR